MYYKPLLLPLLIQVFLTFVIWFKMYVSRVGEMKSKRIHPQRVATREQGRQVLTDSAATADNFMNLFEIPVLFYALALYLFATQQVDGVYVTAAWIFVGFRCLHSLVHCTVNIVMLPFGLYLVSTLAVWFIAARAGMAFLGS